MSFIRERTKVAIDGMRFSLWDYWCPRDGLWHFNPDTKELTQKKVQDFEEFWPDLESQSTKLVGGQPHERDGQADLLRILRSLGGAKYVIWNFRNF